MKPHTTAHEAWTPKTGLDLWDRGYTNLIPLIPPGASLAPGQTVKPESLGKVPGVSDRDGWRAMPDWQHYVANESDVRRWDSWYVTGYSSIGIVSGRDSLVLIDIDITDEALARQACHIVEARHPEIVRRIGQHPKMGLLARIERSQSKITLPVGSGKIEFLCQGQQFVACGIHPLTRKPYSYPNGLPHFSDLPVLTQDHLSGILEAFEAELPGAGKSTSSGQRKGRKWDDQQPNLMLLAEVIELIKNDEQFDDRNDWIAVLYAIKGAYGPDHQDIAQHAAFEFSARWKTRKRNRRSDPGETQKAWDSLDEPEVGWRKLLYYARRDNARRLAEVLAAYNTEDDKTAEEWFTPPPPPPEEELFKEQDPKRRIKLIDFVDFDREPDTPYFIERFIPDRGVGVFYGDTRSFKSFLVADMMMALATDQPEWHGHKITQRSDGVIVYVSGEGVQGMRKRRRAWLTKYGLEGHDRGRLYQVRETIMFGNIEHVDELTAAIRDTIGKRPVNAIFIDTVARAMFGMNENDSKDFGLFTLSCERLRESFNCVVAGVHHTNKQGGSRGTTAISGNSDFVFKFARKSPQSMFTQVTCDKLKDDADGWFEMYELERVEESLVPTLVGGGKAGAEADEPDPQRQGAQTERILAAMLQIGKQWMTPTEIAETIRADGIKITVGNVRGMLNHMRTKDLVARREMKEGHGGKASPNLWALTTAGRKAAEASRSMFG